MISGFLVFEILRGYAYTGRETLYIVGIVSGDADQFGASGDTDQRVISPKGCSPKLAAYISCASLSHSDVKTLSTQNAQILSEYRLYLRKGLLFLVSYP
jgi:hypothetical protein